MRFKTKHSKEAKQDREREEAHKLEKAQAEKSGSSGNTRTLSDKPIGQAFDVNDMTGKSPLSGMERAERRAKKARISMKPKVHTAVSLPGRISK